MTCLPCTVVIIPFTTQLKQAGRSHTVLVVAKDAGLELDSVALCAQMRALDRRRLIRKVGELTPERLSEIELAAAFVLGLP